MSLETGKARERRRRLAADAFTWLIVAGLCVGGVMLVIVTLWPAGWLEKRILALSAIGRTVPTLEVIERILLGLRAAGAVAVAAGLAAALAQRWIAPALLRVTERLGNDSRQLANDIRNLCRGAGFLHGAVLAVILMAGLGVRVAALDQPIRSDESDTFLHFAARPWVVGLSWYSRPNNHILHTLLVRCCYLALGPKLWAIRLPALAAGVALIPAAYLVARALYGKGAALLTAALVAAMPMLIVYSTSARGYSLVCLFTLLIVGLGRHMVRTGNLLSRALFVVFAAAGFYTIPTMLFAFGGVALWLLALALNLPERAARWARGRQVIACAIAAGGITLLLYLPVLIVSGWGRLGGNEYVSPQSWGALLAQLPGMLWHIGGNWNYGVPWAIRIVLAAGAAVALLLPRRAGSDGAMLIGLMALWALAEILLQRVIPFERVWLFALPLYLATASAGLMMLLALAVRRRASPAETVAAVLALVLLASISISAGATSAVRRCTEGGVFPDAEAVTLLLKDRVIPGDCVLRRSWAHGPIEYYFLVHRVPLSYLDADPYSADRVFVVVNDPYQKLEDVIHGYRLPPEWAVQFRHIATAGRGQIHLRQRSGLPGTGAATIPATTAAATHPVPINTRMNPAR